MFKNKSILTLLAVLLISNTISAKYFNSYGGAAKAGTKGLAILSNLGGQLAKAIGGPGSEQAANILGTIGDVSYGLSEVVDDLV